MLIRKNNDFLNIVNSYVIDSLELSNISYMWNFGSLLGVCLIIQIPTGIFLVMHYSSNQEMAFLSVQHIMSDVNYGWLIRYCHSNGPGFFFIFVYIHMARGLYYGSYRKLRIQLWTIGVIIFLVMIITPFLGYCCVQGQMSMWGPTVITNLVSPVLVIGESIVLFLWGGLSVSGLTFQRFFSLHYLFLFILPPLPMMHLIPLHQYGSNNLLGITGKIDQITMSLFYLFKDLITIFLFLFIYFFIISYYLESLGDLENNIPPNLMVTLLAIVLEFYLLLYYPILRSISNKLLGVIPMLLPILVLLILLFVDFSIIRGNAFKLISKICYGFFIVNFILLGPLGPQHIETLYVLISQISTIFYFSYFILILLSISILENVLFYLSIKR